MPGIVCLKFMPKGFAKKGKMGKLLVEAGSLMASWMLHHHQEKSILSSL